jgi:Uncharacterized protein conserved in bacteria
MRIFRATAVLAATLLLATACASSDTPKGDPDDSKVEFPTKRITLIIPYTAGGPTDTVGRAIARYFDEKLGWSVVPENMPGAGAAVGMRALVNSPEDGYTLAITGSNAAVVTPILVADAGYDGDDFVNIGVIAEYPYIIAVGAESGIKDARDFFDRVKANPGSVTLAAPSGTGQISVDIQRLEQQGATIGIVPFDGNAEATAAMLGNNVHGVIQVASQDTLTQIESGKAIPIAVLSAERASFLPDVPTLTELGFKGINLGTSYFALGAPAGVPSSTIASLEKALEEALNDPATQKVIGSVFIPSKFIGAKELDGLFAAQRDSYGPTIRELLASKK